MQEQIITSVAVVVAKEEYTQQEKSLIKKIQQPGAQIEVNLPDDMNAEQFDIAISAVSKVLVRAQLLGESMLPVLGRLLFIADKNPELWKEKFATFEDFRLSLAERFGVGRQTSYDALAYARRWAPVLPPEDFQAVGRLKLGMVAKVVGKGKEGQMATKKHLDFAKTQTAKELEEYFVEKGLIETGETTGEIVKFPANKRQGKDFKKWFADPRVHAKCESDKIADILDLMIAECSTAWYDEGQQLIDSAQEAAQQKEKEEAVESNPTT